MKKDENAELVGGNACPFSTVASRSNQIIYYILKRLARRFRCKTPTRAFHAKTIGLAEATFKVEGSVDDTLPAHLQVGIFATPGKKYQAWVRFTNGSGSLNSDAKKDARGMAIKIINDQPDQVSWKEHDIIMFNVPIFIPAKAAWQLMGVKSVLGSFFQFVIFGTLLVLRFFPKSIWFLKNVRIRTPNVLEECYFSATPFSYGTKAIKWHARPLKLISDTMPEHPSENFLRERLANDLIYKKVSFALYVQFQENERSEPIEDTGVEWKTQFQKVATITLIPQDILTDERTHKDFVTSYSPGCTHPDHKPLGEINQLRQRVYEHLAKKRIGS